MKYLFFCVFALAVGCKEPTSLSKEELTNYISDYSNGLYQSKTVNGILVEISYRPTDLLVAQELGNNRQKGDSIVNILRKKYMGNYYFVLSFSRNGNEALHSIMGPEYGELVQILSFRMGSFVDLTSKTDTVALSDYYMDRTFGMASATSVLLVFERSKFGKTEQISLHIREFGLGIGNLRFNFDSEKLQNVPKMKI